MNWAEVEQGMKRINLGIEYGVTAECRIQDITGTLTLAYARTEDREWHFCDEYRQPITLAPLRVQQVLWQMLPDLLIALCDEADSLAARLRHAVDVLQPLLDQWDREKEQQEMDSMMGLS